MLENFIDMLIFIISFIIGYFTLEYLFKLFSEKKSKNNKRKDVN